MPFQVSDLTNTMKADGTFDAARVCFYPYQANAWYLATMTSGALTGVAASNSTGTVFSFANLGAVNMLVRRIGLSWVTTTGYTGAQYQDFGISLARSFSVADSGGTPWSSASNNTKIRTSLAAPTNLDMRIGTTAALTAGTRSVDTNVIAQAGCWNAAAAAGTYIPFIWLVDQGPGDYPIFFAQNEGFVIWPQTAMGAGGVGTLTVTVEFAEATTGSAF